MATAGDRSSSSANRTTCGGQRGGTCWAGQHELGGSGRHARPPSACFPPLPAAWPARSAPRQAHQQRGLQELFVRLLGDAKGAEHLRAGRGADAGCQMPTSARRCDRPGQLCQADMHAAHSAPTCIPDGAAHPAWHAFAVLPGHRPHAVAQSPSRCRIGSLTHLERRHGVVPLVAAGRGTQVDCGVQPRDDRGTVCQWQVAAGMAAGVRSREVGYSRGGSSMACRQQGAKAGRHDAA